MAEWQAIHRHLFADVYSWAGEPRVVPLWKNGQEFLRPNDFARFLPEVLGRARRADWASMQRLQFVSAAAHLFMDLNWAHPFREGNGRATKIFLDRITRPAPWQLDFSRIDRAEWITASFSAAPAHYHRPVNPERLLHAFSQITVARPVTSAAEGNVPGSPDPKQITIEPAAPQTHTDISRITSAIQTAGLTEPIVAESGGDPRSRSVAGPAQRDRDSGPAL